MIAKIDKDKSNYYIKIEKDGIIYNVIKVKEIEFDKGFSLKDKIKLALKENFDIIFVSGIAIFIIFTIRFIILPIIFNFITK